MVQDLFETEEAQLRAINEFRNLINSSSWKFYVETVVTQNIEVLTESILTGKGIEGEELTEDEIKTARTELALWKVMRDMPGDLIARFEKERPNEPIDDPYFTVDSETDTG